MASAVPNLTTETFKKLEPVIVIELSFVLLVGEIALITGRA